MPLKIDPEKKYVPYLVPALALITFAVFSPVLWHEFLTYDDPDFVFLNPHIQGGLTFEGIRWAFTTPHEANWIPLSWISHMLDVQLFGMDPAGHHFVNLLFHIGSTLLLYVFLKRTTNAPWRSAVVSLLFALHPLHVESVAWIAERKDVLSAFLFMLTLCAYMKYSERPSVSGYLTTLGFFVLGLMAKPMLVTLPFVLLLVDWWPLVRLRVAGAGDIGMNGTRPWRLIAEKVPFAVMSLCTGIITYVSQTADISQAYPLHEKAARALTAYLAYLGKMIWPSDLAVIYPFSPAQPSVTHVAFAAVALAAVTGTALVMKHRRPYLITGWLWYIIMLLPVIGLVQIGHHSSADRYTYLPLVGMFLAVVWGVSDVLEQLGTWRPAAVAIVSAVLIMMVAITSMQLRHWRNSLTLFQRAVAVTESNWIAHNNLGQALLAAGRPDDAIQHFLEAAKVNPSSAMPYLNQGLAYEGKDELLSAINAFQQALQADPGCHPAHLGLGRVYLSLGRRDLALIELEYLRMAGSIHAPELVEAIAGYDASVAVH